MLEELCFEFSDAFLKADCCSLATRINVLCFVFNSFRTYLLFLCFWLCFVSCSTIILMHVPYFCSYFIFCILTSNFVIGAFIRFPSPQPQIVQHEILKAALMSYTTKYYRLNSTYFSCLKKKNQKNKKNQNKQKLLLRKLSSSIV